MPDRVRFHLDENVENAIADGLRQRGIDVTTTPEQGLIAAVDEVQLEFALSQGRVIFTHDTDFLRMARSGVEHRGVVFCRQQTRTVGEIVNTLVLAWEVFEPEEMWNRVEFI